MDKKSSSRMRQQKERVKYCMERYWAEYAHLTHEEAEPASEPLQKDIHYGMTHTNKENRNKNRYIDD